MSSFCYDAQQTRCLLCDMFYEVRRTWLECLSWHAACLSVFQSISVHVCVCKNVWMCVWARGQETTWLGFSLRAAALYLLWRRAAGVWRRNPPTVVISEESKWYQVFRTTCTTAACSPMLTHGRGNNVTLILRRLYIQFCLTLIMAFFRGFYIHFMSIWSTQCWNKYLSISIIIALQKR